MPPSHGTPICSAQSMIIWYHVPSIHSHGLQGSSLLNSPSVHSLSSDISLIKSIIENTWISRKDRYSDDRTSLTEFDRKTRRKVEMYHIGG